MSWKPKFRYNVVYGIGDTTSGVNQITNFLADAPGELPLGTLQVGQIIECASFAEPVEITGISGSTITVSEDATNTGVAVSLSAGNEIKMEYPPRSDTRWIKTAKGASSTTLSGLRQVTTLHIDQQRTLSFGLVNEDITALLENGLYPWAILGKNFQYIEDVDSVSPVWENVELERLVFEKTKEATRGVKFFFAIQMVLRKATAP